MRLQVKQLTAPPPSALPVQPPPMTCQHIDHLDGMHEVRLTTYRAGEHQLVLTAAGAAVNLTASAASKSAEDLKAAAARSGSQ